MAFWFSIYAWKCVNQGANNPGVQKVGVKLTKNGQRWSKIEKYLENIILIDKVKLKQIFAKQLGVFERGGGEL